MRNARLWEKLLGVNGTVVENVVLDEDAEVVVASVRARKGPEGGAGFCQRKCPGYDRGEGRRRWRAWTWGRSRPGWRPTPRG